MNELSTTYQTPSIYDGQTFERLMSIAAVMANCQLIPDCLRKDKTGEFPIEKVQANCFLVAEQSLRWGLSAFAVAQCASVVHGRLMWEGKLVAGVLESLLGIRLNYTYSGEGEKMTVVVSGTLKGEATPRTVTGSVAAWKTDQWAAKNYEQRLAYRGAREWCRRHSPAVMLGIVTDDDESLPMRNVTPTQTGIMSFVSTLPDVVTPLDTASPVAVTTEVAPDTTAPLPEAATVIERLGMVKCVTIEDGTWIIAIKTPKGTAKTWTNNQDIAETAEALINQDVTATIKAKGSDYELLDVVLEGGMF